MRNYYAYFIIFFSMRPLTRAVDCTIHVEDPRTAKILGYIFERCFNDKIHQNVFIGNYTGFERNILKELFSIPLAVHLIGSNRIESLDKYQTSSAHAKNITANNFFVFTTSVKDLASHLKILKKSMWWNHEGFFLIINPEINGCEENNLFLRTVWYYNILAAVLVCFDSNDDIELYTFNPYNNHAPRFWELVIPRNDAAYYEENRWTLFQYKIHPYRYSYLNMLCENLNFDKTRLLDGHTIKMGAYVHTNLLVFDKDKNGFDRFGGVNGDITRTICQHLNATIHAQFYNNMGLIDDEGHSRSYLKDLQSNEIEFAMNMNIMSTALWKQQTYPHETSAFCIVSLKNPVSFMEKFKSVFTFKFLVVVGIICFIVIVILKMCLKQPLELALLNFVKILLLPTSLREPSEDCISRVFLLLILILTMITNVIIQGRLSAINMSPNTNPTIDSVADLMESNIPIYGTLSYKELLLETNLTGRYEIKEYPKCVEKLLGGERVACIPGCIEARFSMFEDERFHISDNELTQFFMVFFVKKDWPLLGRFNWIIRRMSEAGLIILFRERETRFFKHNLDTGYKANAINLKSLRFSFFVLMLGLFVSFCVLLLEALIKFLPKQLNRLRQFFFNE